MLASVANLLAAHGVEVEVVVSRRGAAHHFLSSAIPAIETGTTRTLKDLPFLVQYLKRERPARIVSTLFRCNVIVVLASIIAGYRGEVVLRETTCLYERLAGGARYRVLYTRMLYWLMSLRADRVLVPSRSVLPGLSMLSKRYAAKASLAPNPLRVRPCAVKSFDFGLRVVVLSRLDPVKSIDLTISAVGMLGGEVVLEVYGDGPMRPHLEAQASMQLQSGSYHFHGFVSDVESAYERGGVFVICSIHEGFPNAALEAVIAGMCIVVVGRRETFEDLALLFQLDEKCFVESRDPGALAGRLRDVRRDPSRYRASREAIDAYVSGVNERVLAAYGHTVLK